MTDEQDKLAEIRSRIQGSWCKHAEEDIPYLLALVAAKEERIKQLEHELADALACKQCAEEGKFCPANLDTMKAEARIKELEQERDARLKEQQADERLLKACLGEQFICVNDKQLGFHWGTGKKSHFFCGFCGIDFKLDDQFRMCFTNDLKGAGGNPLVCKPCWDANGGFYGLRMLWRKMWEEYRTKFRWWSVR